MPYQHPIVETMAQGTEVLMPAETSRARADIARRLAICDACPLLQADGCGGCGRCSDRWTRWRKWLVSGGCNQFGEAPPPGRNTTRSPPIPAPVASVARVPLVPEKYRR
jgi:hypothetical protein